jgi:beta-lactamase regulating signal transducer with metallopeptidase domain
MFEWLLLHSVAVALLIVLVSMLIAVFRPGPAVRHLLWLIVLLKMLMPPLIAWRLALPAVTEDIESTTASVANVSPTELRPVILAEEKIVIRAERDASAPQPLPASEKPEPARIELLSSPAATSRWWLPASAAVCWLAGALIVAWRQSVRLERWRRLLRLARPAPAHLIALVREQATTWGMRPPLIGVLPGLTSPLIWGVGQPRLLWPEGLEDRLSPDGLRAVIAHELAHVRRRDHWVSWLLLLGGMVWWWHPLYWLIRRRLGREAESACDALAVDSAPQARRAFAEALVEVVAGMARPVAAVPALGMATGRREVERRIAMILTGKIAGTAPRRWLLGALVLSALALPAWTVGRSQEKKDEKAEPIGKEPASALPVLDPEEPLSKERQDKIRDLELHIQKLQEELHQLRPLPHAPPVPPPVPVGYYYEPVTTMRSDGSTVTTYRLVIGTGSRNVFYAVAPNDEISLSRVTYKLSAAKAKALAAVLGEHVKGVVMEVKADGDKLIVTTSPQAQHAVAQMVALLSGEAFKTPRPPHAPQPPMSYPPSTGVPPPAAVPGPPPTIPPIPPGPPPSKLEPPRDEARGKILAVDVKDLMIVDLGNELGVQVGQKFLVYRGDTPRMCIGEIEVIKTESGRSVARAVKTTLEFRPGDWLLHGLTPTH